MPTPSIPVSSTVLDDVRHAHRLLELSVAQVKAGPALKPGEPVYQYNRLREALAILDGFLRSAKVKRASGE